MAWTKTYTTAPAFVADWQSIDRNTGRQIDWSLVPDSYRAGTTYTITAAANAAAEAESLTVDALPVALPVGTVLRFGEGKYARLTAPAAAGATTLAVEKLATALAEDDEATYTVSQSGSKVIPAGTVMSQLSSGKLVPRAARPGSEAAIGLLISTATENSKNDSLSGYGVVVGGVIYENLLPETITDYKTELGTNGSGWVWQTYGDNTETEA